MKLHHAGKGDSIMQGGATIELPMVEYEALVQRAEAAEALLRSLLAQVVFREGAGGASMRFYNGDQWIDVDSETMAIIIKARAFLYGPSDKPDGKFIDEIAPFTEKQWDYLSNRNKSGGTQE